MSKIYAVGDVQGCAPSLNALVKNYQSNPKMIFSGDQSIVDQTPLGAYENSNLSKNLVGPNAFWEITISICLQLMRVFVRHRGLDTVEPIL
jgi:bis(5'-nucleosyl)-tetraphosphatase (symmetrical)